MRRTPRMAVIALTTVWLRSTQTRRAAVILTAAFAIVTAVTLSVSALTLSTGQQQAKQFGRDQQASYFSMDLGDLTAGSTARIRAAAAQVSAGATVWVGSTTLRPDAYPKFFFHADITSLQYLEDTGLRAAYPDRYQLQSGRWPTSPRDVVVSPHLVSLLPDPHAFTVLSGHAYFRIVGTVTDRYATRGDLILAAPGTWESLTPLPTARQYQPIEGQLQFLWNPPATSTQIAAEVSAALPAALRDRGVSEAIISDLSRRTDPPSTEAAIATRDGLISPAPLLLIVLLVCALAVAATRRTNVAAGSTLTAIGVRRTDVTTTQALAALLTAATAAALGLTIGWLASAALRVILIRVAEQPLAPLHLPGRDLLLIAVAGVVTVSLGTLLPTRISGTSRQRFHRGRLVVRAGRWLLGAAAITAGVTLHIPAAPYLLMVGVLLLGPDLLLLLRALLSPTRPRSLVTRGLMRASALSHAAAVIAIGACIAVPLLTAAQLASRQASDATYAYSSVPPDQIWVERGSDTGDVRGVARTLQTIRGFPLPVAVRALEAAPNADGSAGAQATFTTRTTGGTATLVVPTSDALHRLLGDALPDSARATLDRGGVLNFTSARGPQRFAMYANGGQRQRTTGTLPTVRVKVDQPYRVRFSGAILASTARALHLPISAPVKYLYPNVTPAQIQQAVDATTRAGYDNDFIQYNVPPPPPVLPVTAYVFFAGLTLGGFAVILLTTTDQTRRLRSYSGQLIALGLAPGWTRQVLMLQTLLITTVGLTTGSTAGLIALTVVTRDYPVTVTPLLPATLSSAAILATALITVLVAARNLKADGSTR